MDIYHAWCDLKPGVSDIAFAENIATQVSTPPAKAGGFSGYARATTPRWRLTARSGPTFKFLSLDAPGFTSRASLDNRQPELTRAAAASTLSGVCNFLRSTDRIAGAYHVLQRHAAGCRASRGPAFLCRLEGDSPQPDLL